MNSNKDEKQQTISIPTETLVQIYNMLYSVEIKGEAVKAVAFIEQTLEQYLKQSPTPNITEVK